jgi:hypothetical protein
MPMPLSICEFARPRGLVPRVVSDAIYNGHIDADLLRLGGRHFIPDSDQGATSMCSLWTTP